MACSQEEKASLDDFHLVLGKTHPGVLTKQVSTKPLVIHEYNLSMNGVEKADQYTTYYSFVRKSKKWWRKLFFWLFEVAVVNSYILYKITAPRPSTHLEYRRRLVDALASRHIMAAPPRHVGCPRKPHCSHRVVIRTG